MRSIDLIVLHCSATPNGRRTTVEEIRSWHLARGFEDIGYHYVIYTDGSLHPGRDEDVPGAHALGYNRTSIGICMVGGVGGPDPKNPGQYSQAQWETLRLAVEDLRTRYPGITKIVGHRDLPKVNKLCPSFDVATWLAAGMTPLQKHILGGGN